MEQKKLTYILVVVVCLIFLISCATMTADRVSLGLADWYVTNHERLKTEITNAPTPEHMKFLMNNVAPYMDLMKYGIIGFDAVDEKNTENMAFAVKGLLRHGAKVDYDPYKLIEAIRMEDYDVIEAELLVLKNLIIAKWVKL